ncbi:MAG: sulfurtransferase complex subunit TusD [Pseudohongiellaceae bacterium]
MKFTLVIHAAPYSREASLSALAFTRSALDQGHEITRLFFYSDGVHNTGALAVPPQDEIHVQARWRELIREHKLDAVACVSSALRRGILNSEEAQRYELDHSSLMEDASISGLGQLVDACLHSDRVINFG